MTFRGIVQHGTIALPPGVQLPEGAEVQVVLLPPKADSMDLQDEGRLHQQFLLSIAGTVEGLPEDAALQHDHYLYGTPKQ